MSILYFSLILRFFINLTLFNVVFHWFFNYFEYFLIIFETFCQHDIYNNTDKMLNSRVSAQQKVSISRWELQKVSIRGNTDKKSQLIFITIKFIYLNILTFYIYNLIFVDFYDFFNCYTNSPYNIKIKFW